MFKVYEKQFFKSKIIVGFIKNGIIVSNMVFIDCCLMKGDICCGKLFKIFFQIFGINLMFQLMWLNVNLY